MATTNFGLLNMHNRRASLTLENMYRRFINYSGIHYFKFDDAVRGFVPSKWSALADGYTFTDPISDGVYDSITKGAVGTPENPPITWYSDDMPHSYQIELNGTTDSFGVVVRGDGISSGYMISIGAFSSVGLYDSTVGAPGASFAVYKMPDMYLDDTVVPMVTSIPTGMYGKYKIAVRDTQFNSVDTGRIIYITVWFNDMLIGSYSDNVRNVIPPLKMGIPLICLTSASIIYSGLRIAQLGEIIPWSSIDPSEAPMGAIQRAIEDRYIKHFVRFDGAFRAVRPSAQTVKLTVDKNSFFTAQRTIDRRQIISNIRFLGAFQWVRIKDDQLTKDFGTRFHEVNNTNLWNVDDCYKEALQLFVRMKEQIYRAEIEIVGHIMLEPEDRIQIPSLDDLDVYEDYIIDSINSRIQNGVVETQVSLRRYFYGEP